MDNWHEIPIQFGSMDEELLTSVISKIQELDRNEITSLPKNIADKSSPSKNTHNVLKVEPIQSSLLDKELVMNGSEQGLNIDLVDDSPPPKNTHNLLVELEKKESDHTEIDTMNIEKVDGQNKNVREEIMTPVVAILPNLMTSTDDEEAEEEISIVSEIYVLDQLKEMEEMRGKAKLDLEMSMSWEKIVNNKKKYIDEIFKPEVSIKTTLSSKNQKKKQKKKQKEQKKKKDEQMMKWRLGVAAILGLGIITLSMVRYWLM